MKNYRNKISIEKSRSESLTDLESVKEQDFVNLMVEIIVSMTMRLLSEETNRTSDSDS